MTFAAILAIKGEVNFIVFMLLRFHELHTTRNTKNIYRKAMKGGAIGRKFIDLVLLESKRLSLKKN